MASAYDEKGREIEIGDILKVFHFIGARRKRHYMYKQVVGAEKLGRGKSEFLKISHLDLNRTSYYHERKEDKILKGYEIVQSCDAKFEDRPINRKALSVYKTMLNSQQ